MAKDLFGDLSSDSSAERSRYREKKSKINCGRGSKYRKPVKGRDRGAMTGKFYRAKNAGGSKRKTEKRTGQSAQTKRKGTGRRKTNEKSVNFMSERAKALAWREKKDYNGTEQDERAGTE